MGGPHSHEALSTHSPGHPQALQAPPFFLPLLPIPGSTQRKRGHRPQPFLAAPRKQANKQREDRHQKKECNFQSTCFQGEESRENIRCLFGAFTLNAKGVPSFTLGDLTLHPLVALVSSPVNPGTILRAEQPGAGLSVHLAANSCPLSPPFHLLPTHAAPRSCSQAGGS